GRVPALLAWHRRAVIVTVTPNPSIDRTIHIDRLERGALIRAGAATSEAAGKGLNVARALAGQGVETLAGQPMARESSPTYLAPPAASPSIRAATRCSPPSSGACPW